MIMTNEYVDLDEDDVIIEGSDLHKALTDVGCTDFECTAIDRCEFYDSSNKIDNPEDVSSNIKHEWLWNFIETIKKHWAYESEVKNSYGFEQLEIISKLDPLLDDHSMMIQNMLKKKVPSGRTGYIFKWPVFIVSNSILVTGTFLYKSLRIPGLVAISSLMASMIYRTYNNPYSIKNLNELISTQNDIYYLYKRTLKILKNSSCLKLSHTQSQKTFSNLGIGRMKYLQPICEDLMQSLERTTRTCYQMSLLLRSFVGQNCENDSTDNLVTIFDDSTSVINGEITYEKLKQHYYIYILVQSEMMRILAILYQDESLDDHIYLQLMSIINSLLQFFKSRRIKLTHLIEEYKSSGASIVRQELKKSVGTKLQDLYMHVDLLARKIQSAYNIVDSIIDDIDSCRNEDSSAEIIDAIFGKMNNAYKEIDTARNFAEFNNLLLGKFRQNQALKYDDSLNPTIVDKMEKILPIVHDTDPQIIDEVFEEYIKDEYLKPLYADNDIDSLERGKLDKLLAKNFMSELKEVLIDKYKTMSERESRALLCYRKKMHNPMQQNIDDNEEKVPANPPIPPPPPPLPQSVINKSIHPEQIKVRTPVPLPRSINVTFSPTARRRCKIDRDLEPGIIEANEKFLMNMNLNIRKIELPTFTTNEETFIGSGENSDEELHTDGEPESQNF